MILNHFMWCAARLQIAGLIVAMAYACPSKEMVLYVLAFYVSIVALAYPMLYGEAKQQIGVNERIGNLLVIVAGAFIVASVVILARNWDAAEAFPLEIADETAPIAWTIITIMGLFTLSNAPAVFAPAMALEQYVLPGTLSTDKYDLAKFHMYMRMNANSWCFLNGGTFLATLAAPSLELIGTLFVVFNLFYSILFIYIIINNAKYEFQIGPFLVFILLLGFSAGGVTIGLLL
jgi:hypothetical protein